MTSSSNRSDKMLKNKKAGNSTRCVLEILFTQNSLSTAIKMNMDEINGEIEYRNMK